MPILHHPLPGFKKAREDAGMTQEQVARCMDECCISTVKNWENGRRAPTLALVVRLADLFNCDVDFLTGRIDSKTHDLQYIQDQTGLSVEAVELLSKWNGSDYSALVSQIIEDESYAELVRAVLRLRQLKQTDRPFTKAVIAHLHAAASGHADYPHYDSPEEMQASYEYSVNRAFMRIVDHITKV